jgi:hypothetical protein
MISKFDSRRCLLMNRKSEARDDSIKNIPKNIVNFLSLLLYSEGNFSE